jgi:hypothetical protein
MNADTGHSADLGKLSPGDMGLHEESRGGNSFREAQTNVSFQLYKPCRSKTTTMTDDTPVLVSPDPLLSDLNALFDAEWHDERRWYPFSTDLAVIVNRYLRSGLSAAFLDSMLKYFDTKEKLPDISTRLFTRDPITFCIAYYIMALIYVTDPEGAGSAAFKNLWESHAKARNPERLLQRYLYSHAAEMAEYYRQHLPVWDLLAKHLRERQEYSKARIFAGGPCSKGPLRAGWLLSNLQAPLCFISWKICGACSNALRMMRGWEQLLEQAQRERRNEAPKAQR